MILVSGKGRATSKGLLTVGIRTLVGTLSRMGTSMASKRTAVAERLFLVSKRSAVWELRIYTFAQVSQ